MDHFYYETFKEDLFEKYKSGVLAKKAAGYDGLVDEADFLFSRLVSFRPDHENEPSWGMKELEYEEIKKLDFDKVRTYYKAFFAPH